MAKRVSVDRWMFTVTCLLVFIGLVMIFSASAVMAKERFGSAYEFLLKQLVWAVAGLAVMIIAMKLDYKRLQHPALVFTALGFTTLFLIAVFFLDRAHGTHRWFHLGPVSFQPSELAKPALILFLAWFLENKTQSIDDWRNTLLPAIVPTTVFLGLIVFQPDLGTAIACAGITACVLFVAGIRLRYFGYAFAASLPALYLLVSRVSYRRGRILAFLNPYADPKGFGFHIIQSLIAVATGGITGQGLMEGKQKLFYLPEPHTDFIFAVTAEELGLVGAMVVIVLFAIFLWRGTRAALRTQDNFGRFLAVGITSMIVLQAFINISVVLGLMPTKGIPLPFVSYGGSSLFVTLACVGVLLNITKQAE
ncbi:MAG TPA: putative lipid II flippase FtsW [Terriglobales bacterium]|nr:putative lipid II flippase FtsW [Terriglobales bacterium]